MSAEATTRRSARERLLAAADELFYEKGTHAVGIDRVIARAGVSKASLYSVFGSKDKLIRAYLGARQEQWRQRVSEQLANRSMTPRDRLLGVFDMFENWFAEPGFRGCTFISASAQALPGSHIENIARVKVRH
jgi:AcrR family transcriptional regulator